MANESNKALPEIKNYMEVCVRDLLGPVLTELKVCNCPRCRYDITAIALNNLPPKYAVTRKGQLYTKFGSIAQQFDVDIIAAITKASKIVSENPRHEQDQE